MIEHPTLARLSFWVPAARMAEFEVEYETRLAPILKKHGLSESSEQGRPTVEGVFSQALWPPGALHRHREGGQKTVEGIFSRLFAVDSPAAVAEKEKALQEDPAWQEALQKLGATFGAAAPDGSLRWRFWFYRAPAGPGKQVPVGPGKGHWRTFDVTDGLVDIFIHSIFQDREGYLWFGSFSGVGRYDGQRFTTFTLGDSAADNTVKSIAQDQEGNLWFGTEGGVRRYDGQRFTIFTTKDGLANNIVTSILEDREGNLWFGTHGGGVGRYDGQQFKSFTIKDGLAHGQVSSICQDHEGNLWFGTSGGVSRYDGMSFTSFTKQDGLAHDEVKSILQDQEGNLWFGTAGGASLYNEKGFTTFTTKDGLAHDNVQAICQDQEGNMWFGTLDGGLSRYDEKSFTTFTEQDGLPSDEVTSVCQDREGHLWIGTRAGGVARYDGQVFQTFAAEHGLGSDRIGSALEDREGNLWFGTWEGKVSHYDGRAFTTFLDQAGLAGSAIWSICQDRDGNLWFGTGQSGRGVRCYDGQHFTSFTTEDGLAHDNVEVVYQDRQGYLWFGTAGGANRYDGREFKHFTAEDGLAANYVRSICQDQEGKLWFGTMDGGVSCYDGRAFKSFTTRDGLAGNQVRVTLQDREGNLWFGTQEGGLSRYDGQQFTTFAAKEGLAFDWVWSHLQDREGHLWFGTLGGGVSRYDGQVFQTLTRQDGLASNGIGAMLQDRAGQFWFGTANGVTRYCPPPPSSPAVFLDAVVADRRYEGIAALEIPATVKLVAFEFRAMSFKTRPEAMVYRYRLEGYEKEWRNTHARRVEYQDLPLGEYTFQVRAVDRDLNYSEPASVRLKVIPDPRDARIDELEQRVRERTRELEEKNRALIVEAALERVRAQVTGMQKSTGILDVVRVMWEELKGLGLEFAGCNISTIDEARNLCTLYNIFDQKNLEERGFTEWGYSIGRGLSAGIIQLSLDEPYVQNRLALWRERRAAQGPVSEQEIAVFAPTQQVPIKFIATVPFDYGVLRLGTVHSDPDQFSDADLALLQRFAEVFSAGYTRFLDLQQAESRTRQTARQAVVDRLRAEIASMRKSADLERITPLLWKELTELGVPFFRCGVFIVDEENASVRTYLTNPEGGSLAAMRLPFDSHPHIRNIVERWQAKEVHIEQWNQQDFLRWTDFLQGQGHIERERYLDSGAPPEALVVHHVPFAQGTLYVGSAAALSSEDIELLKALASAFSIAYARYLDFQRLEEQNRALEQANVQIQEANQHKSQFLARMSHDLRTPMNAIIGYTRILLRKLQDQIDERQYQNLQNIQLSADHLLALINDILDLSRVEAGRIELKPEAVDLRQLVQECAAAVVSLLKPGVKLHQQFAEIAPFYTDPDRLRRVLMNLLSNAVKFTEQGHITVSVQPVGGGVELSVADTGVGIPAEELPHIFEEFRQAERQGQRPEGSGLGLAIAKKSVELLGGSIAVESQVGEGTKFTLRIRDYGG